MTSSSEEEDLYLHANKEKNNVTQRKILPIIPRRQSFISNVLHTPPFKNHKLTPKARYFTENNLNISLSNTPMSFMTKYHAQNKNLYSNEFKKLMLTTLNKIIYQINNLEHKIDMYKEKQNLDEFCTTEKRNIPLPISSFKELTIFED